MYEQYYIYVRDHLLDSVSPLSHSYSTEEQKWCDLSRQEVLGHSQLLAGFFNSSLEISRGFSEDTQELCKCFFRFPNKAL